MESPRRTSGCGTGAVVPMGTGSAASIAHAASYLPAFNAGAVADRGTAGIGGLAQLTARLSDHMPELASALLGQRNNALSRRDEWRFGSNGSLAVIVAGPKRGRWFDHERGVGGHALELLAHIHRVPMRQARRLALDWLGEDPCPPFPRMRPQKTVHASFGAVSQRSGGVPLDSRTRRLADSLWTAAMPLAGSLAETYLRQARAVPLPDDADVLRFHPGPWRNRSDGRPAPAMLARMTCPTSGQPTGTHVTYLRPDGSGKADGPRPKLMLGKAGIIRLSPDEDVCLGLAIAEGIETALSALALGLRPVWAAGSAGAIARFPVLSGLECLTIIADPEPVGLRAARACAERWRAAGTEARVLMPERGDLNDLIRGQDA